MNQLSPHATAAKEIRTKLKAAGIKASVRSECFSMGNAVRVTLKNAPPTIYQSAKDIAEPHQSYKNTRRDDITQVKFVSMSNDISDKLNQVAWDMAKSDNPDELATAPSMYRGYDGGANWLNPNGFGYTDSRGSGLGFVNTILGDEKSFQKAFSKL